MQLKCQWEEGYLFKTQVGEHWVSQDSKPPIGKGSAPTPKELVLSGLVGCTSMDVVGWLKKKRQPLKKFLIEANATQSETHPRVFTRIVLNYIFEGDLDKSVVSEAVRLSQTQYCGVSAMLSKTAKIQYDIHLNHEKIESAEASFAL